MSGPKHTPGPLDLVQSMGVSANGAFHLYIVDADDRKIAALWGGQDEKLANGYLFTAAPALLAAGAKLRAAQQAYMADRGNEALGKAVAEAAAELDAAIAKAKGEA